MTTPAGRLGCPTCGAPAEPDASQCAYCGAQLATTACPSCFGMVFRGSEFCSHCGARVQQQQETIEGEPCPRCSARMNHKQLGDTQVSECGGCGGLWVDAQSFERICADRQRQAVVIAHELPPPMPLHAEGERFYLTCPICSRTMNRTNFAGHSGVVIDICKQHGIWFDRDELRRVIEFIRAGGIDIARKKEVEKLLREQAKLESMQTVASSSASADLSPFAYSSHDETVDLVHVVGGLLRFLAR